MTTNVEFARWLATPREDEHLEFKEAKSHFDKEKLFKYCVAFANEGGGKLILGVSDTQPRAVVGSTAFPDLVEIRGKVFHKLRFRVDVEELQHQGNRVVIFHIPSRPSGTAYDVEGAYLMRSGENLVPMTEDRLRRIFEEGKPEWLEQHSMTRLNAQNIIELLDTQAFFELLDLPYPSHRSGVIDRLRQEQLVDAVDDGLAIRRLGGLLLAKRLCDFPELFRKAPRVVVYTGTDRLETRLDQLGTKGYAVGFKGLVKFIMAQLPQSEVVEDALRKEVKLVPEIVVRELVANALIHQDLMIEGTSLMIEVYSNRLEISNPGEPIVPVERFIDSYRSRNERLADLMRRMHVCEEKGSGIDRVITAAEVFQLPGPDFRAGYERTIVRSFGLRGFNEMDRADRIRACYQHCALRWVMAKPMTNQTLRKRFHLPEKKSASVSQVITAAIEAGLIKPDEKVGGSRKFARYLPVWA